MKKGCLVIFLLSFVMVLGVVGVTFLVLRANNDVELRWTEADFASYLKKGGFQFNEEKYAAIEDIFSGEFEAIGATEVTGSATNAEITAAINKATRENSPLRDIRVKFRDDGRVEASGVINDNLEWVYKRYPEAVNYERYINLLQGRTVKIVASLENVNSNTFDASIEKAYLGFVPLPVNIVNSYTEQLGSEINRLLKDLENFRVDEFNFDSSGLFFTGLLPVEFRTLTSP